jgi:hypothetical protein
VKRESEAMASAEQQAIVNLKLFSRSIGFSVTREVINQLAFGKPTGIDDRPQPPQQESLAHYKFDGFYRRDGILVLG